MTENLNAFTLPDWPSVDSDQPLEFDFRQSPEDFIVIEELGFEPSGEGEHSLLFIEKRNLTTLQVREYLAQRFNIPAKHIGYSGLKDKIAITSQWFSLSKSVEIEERAPIEVGNGYLSVLRNVQHHRKLKIGTHKSNRFKLVLRNLKLDKIHSPQDITKYLDQQVHRIKQLGFPNYFGPQRFGHKGGNIPKALEWFAHDKKISREKRSLYLSSARSFIFNELLSQRLAANSWSQYQPGDKLILCGSQSYFSIGSDNQSELNDVEKRLEEGDIAIAGPMLGQAENLTASERNAIDQSDNKEIIHKLIDGLEKHRAKTLYRAFIVRPGGLSWRVNDDDSEDLTIVLEFGLPKGAFATSLLNEIGRAHTPK